MVSAVVIWCDDHYNRKTREHVFGDPVRLGWDGIWYEVHLCEGCQEEHLERPMRTVVEFFIAHGEKVTLPEPDTTDENLYWCLACGDPQHTIGKLKAHLDRAHGVSPADAYGPTCPLCGSEFERLAQHVGGSHRMETSLAFRLAEQRGDQHQVVATRRRALRGRPAA